MSDIICISNRSLCREDFVARMTKIAESHPKAVVLREKDLPEKEYKVLAEKLLPVFESCGTPLILHYFYETAISLGAGRIHLPLHILREMSEETKRKFTVIGCSCHSAQEAAEAEALGAAYITAGHVFATDCKKGLPPRGLDFLREVCGAVDIPVYAIGGISQDNISSVREAGAAGACVMSGLMMCSDPAMLLAGFEKE
ncbi:MAG TPA: thiamine phosphate synthase [Ruminococcus sp.]|nr:thiamine phosphate synthase [Ruminococcus sp.]